MSSALLELASLASRLSAAATFALDAGEAARCSSSWSASASSRRARLLGRGPPTMNATRRHVAEPTRERPRDAGRRDRRAAGAARASSPGASRSRASGAPHIAPGDLLGAPAARLRRPRCADRRARPRARRPRRQPHGPGLHRRPLGRLPVRRAVARRPRQPADLASRATTGYACTDAWVIAAVRCAPPANRPTPQERDNCLPLRDPRAAAAARASA